MRKRSAENVVALVVLVAVGSSALPCWGRSANVPIVRPGEEVSAQTAKHYGWPEGTLALANRPVRTFGWTHSFNRQPLDRTYFAFRTDRTEDVQALLEAFAALNGTVFVEPRKNPPENGVTLKRVSDDEGVAAVVIVPNRALIRAWYERLPEGPGGTRKFGDRILTEPPRALPPILRVYAGHPAVRLDRLRLPSDLSLQVGSLDGADPAVAEAIREFATANAEKVKEKGRE